MCYGRPGIPFIGLHPHHTTDEEFNVHLADCGADVIIAGHTHIPMFKKVENGIVVNPGALSRNSNLSTYGILYLPELNFEVYDVLQPPDNHLDW